MKCILNIGILFVSETSVYTNFSHFLITTFICIWLRLFAPNSVGWVFSFDMCNMHHYSWDWDWNWDRWHSVSSYFIISSIKWFTLTFSAWQTTAATEIWPRKSFYFKCFVRNMNFPHFRIISISEFRYRTSYKLL